MANGEILLEDLLHLCESGGRIIVKFNTSNGYSDPLEEWFEHRDRVNKEWLFWHRNRRYFQKGDIAVCMVRTMFHNDVWLLTTIQRIDKVLDVDPKIGGIGYEGTELAEFQKFYGRVLVRFHKGRPISYRYDTIASRMVVHEVLPVLLEDDPFPGYDNVHIDFPKLARVLDPKEGKDDWIGALEHQKAVYLITDVHTGKLYVGSATAEEGMLLKRWRGYALTGHGGNKDLLAIANDPEKGLNYIRENFRYSILENYNARVDDDFILAREQWWMKILDTKAHGYNN